MDKNFKMAPRADEKFEKRDLKRTKSSQKMGPKSVGPRSPSLKSDPLPSGTGFRCNQQNSQIF